MSSITPAKFVLKFDLSAARPSVVCEAVNFHTDLRGDHDFSNAVYVKNTLTKYFINYQDFGSNYLWFYDMKAKNTTDTTDNLTVYKAPRLAFWPVEGDFESMQTALTSSKISATFFDSQIVKHMQSVGIPVTRENVRVYRDSYKEQISKLLLTEILYKKSTATIVRRFDKINGNIYFSLNLNNGIYQINVPLSYGYGSAESLVMRALSLECPRTMRESEYLGSLSITVVDLGYKLKREMFQAAFHI